ncbi:SagB family peptide dehydrogenase [Allorhizocola rhizosphaerae]|uniref:SagB family peptide dehydrogenase n=1 Tax=Allorhizocola rhizosphaerae TaxID=1872709 RepID=UPI0013C2BCFE|nr:SagB family peptide dehydrogenase [Allorhizocola rhizosphaerae]
MDLLSDYECAHLYSAVSDIVTGERFWEGDSGLFYHEFIKLRHFRVAANAPTAPASGHDSFVPMSVTKSYHGSPRITLPPPQPLLAPLGPTLTNRRTRRDYRDTRLDLQQLSTLLGLACGVSATVAAYGFDCLPLRTFPSHGGLQSPEVYLGVRAVDGLTPGVYHYDPRGHGLDLIMDGDPSEQLSALAFGEEYVRLAQVVLLISGVYDRLRWKYGERSYRFLCTDVGFVGQNVCLVSEGLGLGACPVSGFAQGTAEQLIGIDGRSELAMLMLTVGVVDSATATVS